MTEYVRPREAFEAVFENDARTTIAAMDQSGSDVASQKPRFLLPLPKMGVVRQSVPVQIASPLGGKELAHLTCDVSVNVDLGPDRRGIHVSRIGDVLARLTSESYSSLADYASRVAEVVRKVQHAGSARVDARGTFSYLEQIPGVKSKISLESLILSGSAEVSPNTTRTSLGVGFNHITACPCVQETFRHSFGENSRDFLSQVADRQVPLITHSQRCSTSVVVENGRPLIVPIADLLKCIDGVVIRTQNTMPRELELQTVHAAHKKAQFLEDVLRDLLVAVRRLLTGHAPDTLLRVKSVSYESIHDFDLEGEVSYTLGQIDELMTRR